MTLKALFSLINESFVFFFVFPSIVVIGLYLSWRLRFLQVTKLRLSARYLFKADKEEQGNISHYQALSAVVAGNLGTGNISGMAIALATGGPGALVWMWVMAILGSMIQYASCILGVKYREKNEEGEYVGGPMYYLKKGLGLKKIAFIFSFFALLAALTVGNFAQVNSIVLPLKSLGLDPLVCGLVMMAVVAAVVLGGIQRLAKVASSIVPVMALIYLGTSIVILAVHYQDVFPAIGLMLKSAIGVAPMIGGTLGFAVIKALTTGFERGVFATDAGTGIVPILQASARTKHPVIDGVVTLIAPFIVMIICTTTGLMLIVTGAYQQEGLQSTNMVTFAFTQVFGHGFGHFVVVSALALFAYTTIIAWGCCGEKAANFLWGKKSAKWFQYMYLLLIPVGAIAHVDLVWILADISISLMLLANLIGIAGLSKEVITDTRAYFGYGERPSAEVLEQESN